MAVAQHFEQINYIYIIGDPCLVEVYAGSKRNSEAESNVVIMLSTLHIWCTSGVLDTLNSTRFTVGLRTLDPTKWCDFANM